MTDPIATQINPAADMLSGKTIKQLASELGVTQQAIRHHLNKLPSNLTHKFEHHPLLIDANGESILRSFITPKKTKVETNLCANLSQNMQTKDKGYSNKRQKINKENTNTNANLSTDFISILQSQIEQLSQDKENQRQDFLKQLDTKDRQLNELTIQIQELTSALLVAQQTVQAAQALHAGTMQARIGYGSKGGFFARWFGGRAAHRAERDNIEVD